MINVNNYIMPTDSETFEKAMQNKDSDGIVLIPPRKSDKEPERTYWLIDRAILLDENTTVIMQNSTIKLSDKCRDNFFRTANCGMGIEFPKRIKNVHIRGEGLCTLLGADHPRATGDGGKIIANPCPYEVDDLIRLAPWIPEERRTRETISFADRHDYSYGTDAGTDESQYGDWRGIGVLFANTENFSIGNIHITESHGWGISLEECAFGYVEKICFDACMSKMIDGLRNNMENQDGVDIRNGCHHITVSDITGKTGDDVVALTAIADENYRPGGSLCSTHVMHNDWSKRSRDIHDITIKNVTAHSDLCWTVRLLPANAHIRNVRITGITDEAPENKRHWGTIILGVEDIYGKILPESMKNIVISDVICGGDTGIMIGDGVCDSVISNVVSAGEDAVVIRREENAKNLKIENVVGRRE